MVAVSAGLSKALRPIAGVEPAMSGKNGQTAESSGDVREKSAPLEFSHRLTDQPMETHHEDPHSRPDAFDRHDFRPDDPGTARGGQRRNLQRRASAMRVLTGAAVFGPPAIPAALARDAHECRMAPASIEEHLRIACPDSGCAKGARTGLAQPSMTRRAHHPGCVRCIRCD